MGLARTFRQALIKFWCSLWTIAASALVFSVAKILIVPSSSISKSVFYDEESQKNLVRLQNSMTAELDIMRANILYDGLEVLAHNINRKMPNLKLFEFGNVYNTDYSQDEKLVFFQI